MILLTARSSTKRILLLHHHDCGRRRQLSQLCSKSSRSVLLFQLLQQRVQSFGFSTSSFVLTAVVNSHLRPVTEQDVQALRQILLPTTTSATTDSGQEQEQQEQEQQGRIGRIHHANSNSNDDDNDDYAALTTTLEQLRHDWTGHYAAPHGTLVVQPSTVAQVAHVLRYCQDRAIGVIAVSGNTGLVGGSMPCRPRKEKDNQTNANGNYRSTREILLSLRRLNRIESLSSVSGIVRAQAGVILQTLQDYTRQQSWLLPLDLGAKGSCCVGGNIATNAGGSYYYRYGSLAANLIGLQVVTANGTILDLNYSQCLVSKNNTGYKLHQLLVGSEGTLGIITGVALQCKPFLFHRQTAWLACSSFAHVLQTVQLAQQCLGEILAAAEWMDGTCLALIAQTHPHYSIPLWQNNNNSDHDNDHYLLIETHGSNAEHDASKLDQFLEQALASSAVRDGILAQDTQQQQELWRIRESANPATAATGYTYKYDVSLPDSQFDGFIAELRERLRDSSSSSSKSKIVQNSNWGHVLDGNLHCNVTVPGELNVDRIVLATLEPFVFEAVQRRGGSISAEHGIGQSKRQYMAKLVHDEATLQIMKAIKQVWDPRGILNPGKVLPIEDDY